MFIIVIEESTIETEIFTITVQNDIYHTLYFKINRLTFMSRIKIKTATLFQHYTVIHGSDNLSWS